ALRTSRGPVAAMTPTGRIPAALDFARADGASGAEADAVVLGRADGNVRYLTAPWVTATARRDLMKPAEDASELTRTDGVTSPMASPATKTGACTSWNALQVTDDTGTHVLSDLGELVPARLTVGHPGKEREVAGSEALRAWAPYACSLGAVRSQGVRSVNAWAYAEQRLPDGSGSADWVCTRAETWRGGGARVLAQFHTPGGTYGAVAAKAEDVPACGPRDPQVLAGVLWKAQRGTWYLLAAGGKDTASIRTTGGLTASGEGHVLAVRARQGLQAELKGTLDDGREIGGLH
ncbi:hypothetical protein ACWDTB_17240, partial [Streptomyces sp. NPDC003487]